jgi:hypothetical protein
MYPVSGSKIVLHVGCIDDKVLIAFGHFDFQAAEPDPIRPTARGSSWSAKMPSVAIGGRSSSMNTLSGEEHGLRIIQGPDMLA